MNKGDFIACIAEKLATSKAEAARNLDAVQAAITEVFAAKESLTLPGFITVGVKKRAARSGRNPSTGKTIQIAEATVPFVRISPKIKALVNTTSSAKTGKKASISKKK